MRLAHKLRKDFPEFSFVTATRCYWSPSSRTIFFEDTESVEAQWDLLHELGHALCEHANYFLDIELVRKEAEAWLCASKLTTRYLIPSPSDEYVQTSLDTYRDWLQSRSSCPRCRGAGLQQTVQAYTCPNCKAQWQVSTARFCRPYRLRTNIQSN
jgi:hypothetical protein